MENHDLNCTLTPEQVASWVGPKPRVLVINRADCISSADKKLWSNYFEENGARVGTRHMGQSLFQVLIAFLFFQSRPQYDDLEPMT